MTTNVNDIFTEEDPVTIEDFLASLESRDALDEALIYHSELIDSVVDGTIDDIAYEEGLSFTKEILEQLGESDIIEKLETPQERTDRNKPKPASKPATYREITTNLGDGPQAESQTKLQPLMQLLENGYMIRGIDIEGGTITFFRSADGEESEHLVTISTDLLTILANALGDKAVT